MKRIYSTAEVARAINVHKQTLLDWLRVGKVPEPRRQSIGGVEVRIWSEKDVSAARKYREQSYGKWGSRYGANQ